MITPFSCFPTKKRIIDVNYIIIKFVLCPVFTAVNRASEFPSQSDPTQPSSVLVVFPIEFQTPAIGPIVFDSLNYIIIHTYYSGFIVIYYIRYCWYDYVVLFGSFFFYYENKNEKCYCTALLK